MDTTTKTQQAHMMKPNNNDIVSVLSTRNIMFAEAFTREYCLDIIDLLKLSNEKYKQTIIMITHNMEIAKCADRIIKIEDGKLLKEV